MENAQENTNRIIQQAGEELQNVIRSQADGRQGDEEPSRPQYDAPQQNVQDSSASNDSRYTESVAPTPQPASQAIDYGSSAAQLLDEARQLAGPGLPVPIETGTTAADASKDIFQQIAADAGAGSPSGKPGDDIFQQIVNNAGTSSIFDEATQAGKTAAQNKIQEDANSIVQQAAVVGKLYEAIALGIGALQVVNGVAAPVGEVVNEVLPAEGFLQAKAVHGVASVAQGLSSLSTSDTTAETIAGSGKATNGLSQIAASAAQAAGAKSVASLFDVVQTSGDIAEAMGKTMKAGDQSGSGDTGDATTSGIAVVGTLLDVLTESPEAKALKMAAAIREGNVNVKQGIEKLKQSAEQMDAIDKQSDFASKQINQIIEKAKARQQ